MTLKPTTKQQESLNTLAKLDEKWQGMKENYKNLWPPFEISCFSKLKQALPIHYRVVSAEDHFYHGGKKSIESQLAKSVGFHTRDENPRSYDYALAFVKMHYGRSEGALVLYLAQKHNDRENYSIKVIQTGESIRHSLNKRDITYLLGKAVDIKAKTTKEIQRSLKKYVGKEDQRISVDLDDDRLTFRLQKGKTLDKGLWTMLGSLDSKFLRRTDVQINGSSIAFETWDDLSNGDAPGYNLNFRIATDNKTVCDSGICGDHATAQKIILDICKENDIKLPKDTVLDELD